MLNVRYEIHLRLQFVQVANTPFVRTGNTFCFSGASGGPNEDDCRVVADALLYDSQNEGPLFNITASGVSFANTASFYAELSAEPVLIIITADPHGQDHDAVQLVLDLLP